MAFIWFLITIIGLFAIFINCSVEKKEELPYYKLDLINKIKSNIDDSESFYKKIKKYKNNKFPGFDLMCYNSESLIKSLKTKYKKAKELNQMYGKPKFDDNLNKQLSDFTKESEETLECIKQYLNYLNDRYCHDNDNSPLESAQEYLKILKSVEDISLDSDSINENKLHN